MSDLSEMTQDIIEGLKRRGQNPRVEVRTAAGVADIVTDKAVYEIATDYTHDAVKAATDHVLACRDAIDPGLRAVVWVQRPIGHPRLDLTAAERRGVVVNVHIGDERSGMT